jgi:multicomponent K+:H+ antiporter subunit E
MKRTPLLLLAALVVIWLLLNAQWSWSTLAVGVVLASLLVMTIGRLRPVRPRVRNLHLAVPLLAAVLLDIARSNLAVSRIILGLAPDRAVRSGFLDIPLELRDPHGLAVLAVIVTSTPGTAWAGLTPDGRVLRLHVLDLKNEDEWIGLFKQQYEQRLLRIFE